MRTPTAAASAAVRERFDPSTALLAVLVAGFIVRMFFIGADGYRNDVSSFMSWAITVAQNPLGDFYAKAGFADYPPGYLLVLWIVGKLYLVLPHPAGDYSLLRYLVKLPSCLFDILDAWLIFTIARRFVSETWAVGAAALFALNPAAIYVSAYWGQVDSVPAGFMLGAIALLLYAPARPGAERRWYTIAAWLCIAYAILIKPPAVMIAILMVAWIFATREPDERRTRLVDTAIGIACGLALAFVVAFAFHPQLGNVVPWLIERYSYGSAVYPYNSVNAFNLHSLFRPFWQSDTGSVTLGPIDLGPMWLWGVVLVAAAAAIVIARYVQRADEVALLEAAMLLSLAFFVLATRMHERYVYNAFVLLMPLAVLHRRYLYGAIAITITLLANLWYSLYYAHAMEAKLPVNGTDIFPWLTHPMSLVNVAVFFALGYVYLGAKESEPQAEPEPVAVREERAPRSWLQAWWSRPWYSPLQGLVAMTRTDWIVLGAFTLVALVIDFIGYWNPNERYFDEIYYPRSGIEYLKGVRINTDWEYPFEWTHPPLTKLMIAASIWMFGGVAHGDNGWGWRFLNVICGSLMVPLCYAFAKRITASTLFASIAAFMLTFDGFRFVQSRIATPEIWVAAFTLAFLYAFYRLWTAAQVRIRIRMPASLGWKFWATLGLGTLVALAFTRFVNSFGATPPSQNSYIAAFLYAELGFYLLARWVGRRYGDGGLAEASYAEGTRVFENATQKEVVRWDGGGTGEVAVGELYLDYARDGSLTYATPEGTVRFTPEGEMRSDVDTIKPADVKTWFVAVYIFAALLASSKWNGLFDFFVMWVAVAVVFAQRFIRWPATLGNPRGFTPDLLIGGMLFVVATVYFACYFPNYRLGYNLADIIGMQQQMYWYHSQLSKTNPASLNHPYGSYWWQWPTLFAPISYYWHDSRVGAQVGNGAACCVAEILALPNPIVWWFGLFTVPAMAWWGIVERNKAYLLLAAAYLFHWLPWILTPRIAFEYHFFPNLAIIVLANAIVLQRWWNKEGRPMTWLRGLPENRLWIGLYLAGVLACFAFFYPITAATPITYDAWHERMWLDNWLDLLPGHPHPHGLSWIKPN